MDDAPSFFQLLDEHFDIREFIPSVFTNAFYQHFGRKRLYPLTGFLSALILQKIFSIPTDSLLILFLSICKELRDFCGFSKVPDAPLFTRFRQNFESFIELMFRQMVDFTEPICQLIDSSLAQILTFDTSAIELFVTKNNPKTLNARIKKSAFDSADIYGALSNDFGFQKALIPYNPRNESSLKKVSFNEYGYPTCPNDSSLAMKYCGITKEKGRSDRIKWCCPKVHMVKGQWICDCPVPCSTAKKGRTTYSYENMEFRMFPGIQRDSPEWIDLYKIRTSIERAINHFKTNMCIAGKRTRNHATIFL